MVVQAFKTLKTTCNFEYLCSWNAQDEVLIQRTIYLKCAICNILSHARYGSIFLKLGAHVHIEKFANCWNDFNNFEGM